MSNGKSRDYNDYLPVSNRVEYLFLVQKRCRKTVVAKVFFVSHFLKVTYSRRHYDGKLIARSYVSKSQLLKKACRVKSTIMVVSTCNGKLKSVMSLTDLRSHYTADQPISVTKALHF